MSETLFKSADPMLRVKSSPFKYSSKAATDDVNPPEDMRGKPCTPGHTELRDQCIPKQGGSGVQQQAKPDDGSGGGLGRGRTPDTSVGGSDTGGTEGTGRVVGGSDSPSNGGTPSPGKIKTQEERIVTARPELTKLVDTSGIPEDLSKHLKEHQQQAVAKAKFAMDKYGGFMLADGTGGGKTRSQLAVAKMYADEGKKVIIISKSQVIKPTWNKGTFGGSFAEDGETMGIDMELTRGLEPTENGKIYLSTYQYLDDLQYHVDKDTVVIYDESHTIKNFATNQGIAGNIISKQAGSVMYASATPLDKPLQVAYLFRARLFGDRPWEQTRQSLGFIKKTHKYGGKSVTTWDINPAVGTNECMRRLSGLFDKMVEEGLMLKREISWEGIDINFETVKMPPEAHDMMDDIAEAIASKDLPAMVKKGVTLQHQRRQQETFKVPVTADRAIAELNEGRSVVIFCSRRSDAEVLDVDGNVAAYSESTIKLMREELEKKGIDPSLITELHGGQSKKEGRVAMDDFQSNKARIIIATVDSGGTGINLDDRTGDHPRTMLMMTPPFSGMDNVQAAGRVWRMSTKSAPRIKYILGDTDVDMWNASIVSKKMKIMGATVSGEISKLDPEAQFEGEDAMDEILTGNGATPYKWPISLTGDVSEDSDPMSQLGAPSRIYHKLNANNATTITGLTSNHAKVIHEQGGQWNKKKGVWYIPHSAVDTLKNLPGLVFQGYKKPKVKFGAHVLTEVPKKLKINKQQMPDGSVKHEHTFNPASDAFWHMWNSPEKPSNITIGKNQIGQWEASIWGATPEEIQVTVADLVGRGMYTVLDTAKLKPNKPGRPAKPSKPAKPGKLSKQPKTSKPGKPKKPGKTPNTGKPSSGSNVPKGPKKQPDGFLKTWGPQPTSEAGQIFAMLDKTNGKISVDKLKSKFGISDKRVAAHIKFWSAKGAPVKIENGHVVRDNKSGKSFWIPYTKSLFQKKKN